MAGMEASIHAPTKQQKNNPRRSVKETVIDLESVLAEREAAPEECTEITQSKRGPGRSKGSKTRSKVPEPPVIPFASQQSTTYQLASQKTIREDANSKRRRTGEPNAMDEQPDDNDWFNIQLNSVDSPESNTQQDSHENRLSQFTGEVTTLDEVNSTPEPIE